MLSGGQNLAQAFNSTANGLTSAQSGADTQVTQTVAQINSLTTQIAQLNGQVAQLTAEGQDGGTTEDQRDELGAAAVDAYRHLCHADQRRRDHYHRQWNSAGDGKPQLFPANDHGQRRHAARARLEWKRHHEFDTGRPAWRSDSDSRSGDSRLSYATQLRSRASSRRTSMPPRRKVSIPMERPARTSLLFRRRAPPRA